MPDLARLGIQIDSAGVVTANNRLDELTRSGTRAETATGRLMNQFRTMQTIMQGPIAGFQAFSSIFGSIINQGAAFVNAYSESAQNFSVLEQVIRATGGAAGYTADELASMALEFKATTLFDDDEILKAQAILLTFRQIGREVFPQALTAATDLSRVMGTDLNSAITMIGKALNDPIQGISALRRVGVQLSDEQERMVKQFMAVNDLASAQAVILSELNGEFGGAARAIDPATQTLNNYADALDSFQETAGEALAIISGPFVQAATESLNAATAAAAAYVRWTSDMESLSAVSKINTQEIYSQAQASKGLLEELDSMNQGQALNRDTAEELYAVYPQLRNQINLYSSTVGEAMRAVNGLVASQAQQIVLARQFDLLRRGISRPDISENELQRYQALSDKAAKLVQTASGGFRRVESTLSPSEQKVFDELNRKVSQLNTYIVAMNEHLKPLGFQLDSFGKIKPFDEVFGSLATQGGGGISENVDSVAEAIARYNQAISEITPRATAGLLGDDVAQIEEKISVTEQLLGALIELQATGVKDNRIGEFISKLTPELKNLKAARDEALETKENKKSLDDLIESMKKEAQTLTENTQGWADYGRNALISSSLARGASEEELKQILDLYDKTQALKLLQEDQAKASLLRENQKTPLDKYVEAQEELNRLLREGIITWKEYDSASSQAMRNYQENAEESADKTKNLDETLKGLANQALNLIATSSIDALQDLGKALGSGTDSARSMEQAMAALGVKIIEALPGLLLQAGLQVIGSNLALGLVLIGASGLLAFGVGVAQGQAEAEQNARGNIIAEQNASGTLINRPTYFNNGGRKSVAGEAGTEALLPLGRDSAGNLGVYGMGGGNANVTVNITNNSGEQVTQSETDTPDGKQIDIIIGNAVLSTLASGKADKILTARYKGLQVAGKRST